MYVFQAVDLSSHNGIAFADYLMFHARDFDYTPVYDEHCNAIS